MNWKKRVAGLVIAAGLVGGVGVLAAPSAAAASCSSLSDQKASNTTWRFTASCSGGAQVRWFVNCLWPEEDKSGVVTFPSTGATLTWTRSCSGFAEGGNLRLIN